MSTRFAKPYDYVVDWLETTGPASYPAGGFNITLTRLKRIVFAIVQAEPPDDDNYVYKIEVRWSGNVLTVVVKRIDVTAAAPASWTEPAGADLTGLKLKILAVGE